MIRVLPWLVRQARCASARDFCHALAALVVSPVQNIIFLTIHFSTLLVPIAQQPGQAGVLGRLSLFLWFEHLVMLFNLCTVYRSLSMYQLPIY
jgi:hypothetical protein